MQVFPFVPMQYEEKQVQCTKHFKTFFYRNKVKILSSL